MVCHALGRCRICGRKHKIDVFGSEKDQHYMIEKADLKLIILNTVCIMCIAKIERFVQKINPELIFNDYMKEQDINEEKNELNQSVITSRCTKPSGKKTGKKKTEEKIEREKLYGNETAMDVDTHCTSNQEPKRESWEGINLPANEANDIGTSASRDNGKGAEVKPQFPEDSSISGNKANGDRPEKEALAKLVSKLAERAIKRPQNFSDDKTVRKSPKRLESASGNALKIPASSAVPISNDTEMNRDNSSALSGKKIGRLLICDFCKKKFTHAGDLNKHRRKHTGEKPYECGECKRKFAHASNVARHQRVHSGERPFVCPKCDRGFTRRDKLTIHVAGGRCQIDHSNLNVVPVI